MRLLMFSLLFFGLSARAQMNEADLFNLIRARNVGTVEQLVPLLPPAYRSNFTLVYLSKSIQQASPIYPRAILFGDDGRLLMSFNGHASQFGSNTFEIVVYKENPPRFEPKKIFFRGAKDIPAGASPLGTDAWADEKPKVCAACHGQGPNFHPIFKTFSPSAAYPRWGGFFGGDADVVIPGSPEYLALEFFLKGTKREGNYRALSVDSSLGLSAPYRTNYLSNSFDVMPNTRLLGFMTRLLAKTSAWRIMNGPNSLSHDGYLFLMMTVCDPRAIELKLREKVQAHIKARHDLLPQTMKDLDIRPYSINEWDPYASLFLQINGFNWWQRSMESHQTKIRWLDWWSENDGVSHLASYEATEVFRALASKDAALRPYFSPRLLPSGFPGWPASRHDDKLNQAGYVLRRDLAVGACPLIAERVNAALSVRR